MAPGDEGQTQTHPRKGESLSSSRGCQVRGVSGPEAVVPSQLECLDTRSGPVCRAVRERPTN